MNSRQKAFLCLALVLGLVGLGAVFERARGGIDLVFLAFLGLLGAPLLRVVIGIRHDALPREKWLVLLTALSGTSSFVHPETPWPAFLLTGFVFHLSLTTSSTGDVETGRGEKLVVGLWTLLNGGLLLAPSGVLPVFSGITFPLRAVFLPLLALFSIMSFRQKASWTIDAIVQRAATQALVSATLLVSNYYVATYYFTLSGVLVVFAVLALLVHGGVVRGQAIAFSVLARAFVGELRRRKLLLFRLILSTTTLGLLWGLGEVAIRIVPNSHREVTLGHSKDSQWHVPNTRYVYYGATLSHKEVEGTYANVVNWNNKGYHDVSHEVSKPKGHLRTIVLGDSFVEGVQVKLDELYHRLLGRELGKRSLSRSVETISLAASGWGQEEELDALRREGGAYSPDLLVVEFLCANDVRNNHKTLEQMGNECGQSWFRGIQARALEKGLFFTAFLAEKTHFSLVKLSSQRSEIDSDVFRETPDHPTLWAEAWTKTEALVLKLKNEAEILKAPLVFVIFTSPIEIQACNEKTPRGKDHDFRLPARKFMEICRKAGVPCLDLAPRFFKRGGEELARVHGRYDPHWGRIGHQWAAEETTKFLTEETDLWQRVLAKEP